MIHKIINIPALIGRKEHTYKSLEGEYDELKKRKQLVLCVNVGRSGTRWLANIFDQHDNAVGSCERLVNIESFYRYVKWYKLNIDLSGVINGLKDSIVQDWKVNNISMLVSPYLSHDLMYLYETLKPDKIIWGVNDPRFTITSFYNKGWYGEYNHSKNEYKIPGLSLDKNISHSLGRIIPDKKKYQEWLGLTQIGKISWFYNAVNMEIYEALKNIPKECIHIYKLEESDQNYNFYLDLVKDYNLTPVLSKKKFLNIKNKTVRKKDNVEKIFNELELKEFNAFTKEFYKNIYLKINKQYYRE